MKKIIGILGVIAITMTMFFSTGIANVNDIDLANLITINTASAEFAHQPEKRTKNVSCIKQIGATTIFGYRDKCKRNGTGCTPTACI